MAYVTNTKIRVGRVRVTARLTSKPDHRGRSKVLAHEGQLMSTEEAFRQSIPAKHLEPVGPGGDQLLDSYKRAMSDKDNAPTILADARQTALDAERAANQESDLKRSNRAGRRDNTGDVDFPQHRGGGTWLLSNGDTFRGKKEEAEEAEAALHADDEGDQEPQSFAEELTTVEGVSDDLAGAIADQLDRDELAELDTDGQLEQLQTVEGVGEATAKAIVDGVFS